MTQMTTQDVEVRVLTVEQVAQRLGIGRSKAYELVRIGAIPRLPLPGRSWRVSSLVIDRLLREGVDRIGQIINE